MDRQKYILIKQYIGLELLMYSLNYTGESSLEADFLQLSFNNQQLDALNNIHNFISDVRLDFINQNGFGDGFECRNFYRDRSKEIFNGCRAMCNGEFPSIQDEDKLLKFIQSIAIEEYPNLLIKSSNQRSKFFSNSVNLNLNQMREFEKLVKEDVLNTLTNKKEENDYYFDFKTTYNLNINLQVWSACGNIISKSFDNCCKKMKYDLNSFLNEIKTSLENLRKLAEGKIGRFSIFIGIQGIIFQNLNEIEFSDCILRTIDDKKNPGALASLITTTHSDDSGRYISGGVIEIKYNISIRNSGDANPCNVTPNLLEYAENCFDNIRLALCFSLDEDYAFIRKFQENGFVLLNAGTYSFSEKFPRKYIKIPDSTIDEVKNWYNLLASVDKQNIAIPLRRMSYAIYERMNPEDSITDAIIAWEGMFSEAFETTFKVTGSIAKFLGSSDVREDLCKLRKLYDLRSDIVHGKNKKDSLLYKENKEKLRSDVIKIGLKCLKKLIITPELLKMSPSERVKEILIFT